MAYTGWWHAVQRIVLDISTLTLQMCVAIQYTGSGVCVPLLRATWYVLEDSESGPRGSGQSRFRSSVLLHCWPCGEQPESSKILSVLWGEVLFLVKSPFSSITWHGSIITFTFIAFFLVAVPAWLHQTLQALSSLRQRLRPSLPFPEPLHWPRQSPAFHLLHPRHGDFPYSVCCHGDVLPVQQDVWRRSQSVTMPNSAGWRVLGRGHDGFEWNDSFLGCLDFDWTVWCCCLNDHHLLQTHRNLWTTEVTKPALGHSSHVSAWRAKMVGQQDKRWGQISHRNLKLLYYSSADCVFIIDCIWELDWVWHHR